MDMKELSSILQQNGIVGAGGAGFPTYAKLDQRAETIILNCAECEPLLRLHRQLLEKYAREIVDTFHLVGQAVGAKEVIIGIKKAYKQTIEAVESVIGEYPEVRLGLLDEVYPAGDEVVLIYEVTGKVVRPGGLPIESGVAVFNVETIYNVWRAMNQQTPVVDKLIRCCRGRASGDSSCTDRNYNRGSRGTCRRNNCKRSGIFYRRTDDGIHRKRFAAGYENNQRGTGIAAGSLSRKEKKKQIFH